MLRRLSFLLRSQNDQELHSPFVYELFEQVIKPNLKNYNEVKFLQEAREFYRDKMEIIQIKEMKNPGDFQKNQLVYLSLPEKNRELFDYFQKNKAVVFSINFYFGAIFSFNPIAPKQNFYLR